MIEVANEKLGILFNVYTSTYIILVFGETMEIKRQENKTSQQIVPRPHWKHMPRSLST